MQPVNESEQNGVGLYRHPQSKIELGALEPAAADAFVRQGFILVKSGVEAANSAKSVPATEEAPKAPQAPVKDGE